MRFTPLNKSSRVAGAPPGATTRANTQKATGRARTPKESGRGPRRSTARSVRLRSGSAPAATACAVLCALLVSALVAIPEASCQESAPDTTAAEGKSARDWLPHGTYQTNYDVNRTVQSWTQTFNTPYSIGNLRINSNVSYGYSTDSNNERKTVNRIARTSFNYLPLEGLKLGLALDVTRNNMETPTADTRSKTDREKIQLTGEYSFSPLDEWTMNVSAKTGGVDELLENRTVGRQGRGRSSSADFRSNYKPWEFMTWGLDLGTDVTSLDSEDSKTGLKTKDKNTGESYRTSFDFRPGNVWGASLGLRRLESQFQYPKEEEQETKTGLSNAGDVSFWIKPLDKMNLNLSASVERKTIDFAVERVRSTLTEVESFNGDFSYELFGVRMETRMSWDDQRSEYGSGPEVPISVLSQAGYLYTRSLQGSLSRNLGKKVEARANADISLRSYDFDDKENNPDDRDLLNQNLSLDATYTPTRKFSTGLGLSKRTSELVYISPEKSTNNREAETYAVTANFTYRMSPTTSISQNTRMSADYSFYEFSDERDFLLRNTILHTVLRTRVMRGVGLVFIHDYRHQDQGGVSRRGGTVYYGRTGDNDRHDLTVMVDYEPVSGVNMTVSQRFQQDKRFSISEEDRTLVGESERAELLARMNVKYKITDNTNFDGRFERMDSSAEGRYWRVTATFRRNF